MKNLWIGVEMLKLVTLKLLPVKDPVQVFKALGGLEVIRKEKVVCEGNKNPDKIGTQEERLASQLVNPVARCCNLPLLITNCEQCRKTTSYLGGCARGLGLVNPGGSLEE